MKSFVFSILIAVTLSSIALNPLSAKDNGLSISKSIVVFPFNFEHSQKAELSMRGIHHKIENLLFTETKYHMINPQKAELLTKINQSRLFKSNSKDDTANIGTFLTIDYIVMGDVIHNKNLIIKIVDIKRKEVIFTRVYDIIDGDIKLAQTVTEDIDTKLKGYSFAPYNFFTRYSYFIPMNDLAEIVECGHGAGVGFSYELPFIQNLLLGVEMQYFYLEGKTSVTHHAIVMPMMASLQYHVELGSFYVVPGLAVGTSYNALFYFRDTDINKNYTKRDSYDNTYKAGLIAGYSLNNTVSFFSSFEFGLFANEKRDNRFGIVGFGMRVVF